MEDKSELGAEVGDVVLGGRPDQVTPVDLDRSLVALPFSAMTWEDFEKLLVRVLHDVTGLRGVTVYGTRGQKQHGLDVVGRDADGNLWALQSKRQQNYDETDLADAVQKFIDGKRKWETHTFVLATSCEAHTTQVVDATVAAHDSLDPVEFEFWDADRIGRMLRTQPAIVAEFFGEQAATRFCAPFQRQTIPAVDAVAVAAAAARTPLISTGAAKLVKEAENVAAERPEDAVALIEQAQAKLGSPFTGYADSLERRRIELLTSSRKWDDAAAACLAAFWTAVEADTDRIVDRCRDQGTMIARDSEGSPAAAAAELIMRSVEALRRDPLGRVNADFNVPEGVAPLDRARLLVLYGEAALATGDAAWLQACHTNFVAAIEAIASEDEEVLKTRLQLLAAEADGEWSRLVKGARLHSDGYAAAALVHARYARWCALREQFELADGEWAEAVGDACLGRSWSDAATWVAARRTFSPRWRLPMDDEDLLTLQQSLARTGDSVPIVGSGKQHVSSAMRSLNSGTLRAAALSGQRALREAVAGGDWFGEVDAHRILADTYRRSGELDLAARHAVLAAESKSVKVVVAEAGDQWLDVSDLLGASNYWTSATALSMITAQADLVPDEKVGAVSAAALAVLERHRDGTLVGGPFSPNPLREAVRALSGIANRISLADAERALVYFEAQPVIDESHYRFHDEEEATTLARISANHPELRVRVMRQLVTLCARSQPARSAASVHDALEEAMPIIRETLHDLAGEGNDWAAQRLSLDEPLPTDDSHVQRARRRMLDPLDHAPGVYTVMGGIVEDSLLLLGLSPSERAEIIQALLDKSRDTKVGSPNRCDYLTAASNLASDLEQADSDALFTRAVQNVTDPAPCEADDTMTRFSHPLSTIRMDDGGSSAAAALRLAARLARTADQQAQVRELVLNSMLKGDQRASVVLAYLPPTPDDINLLAHQQDSGSRQVAALRWAELQRPRTLGEHLAQDPDPAVRRTLAHALARQEATDIDASVRALISSDARYSVRSLLPGVIQAPARE